MIGINPIDEFISLWIWLYLSMWVEPLKLPAEISKKISCTLQKWIDCWWLRLACLITLLFLFFWGLFICRRTVVSLNDSIGWLFYNLISYIFWYFLNLLFLLLRLMLVFDFTPWGHVLIFQLCDVLRNSYICYRIIAQRSFLRSCMFSKSDVPDALFS